MNRLLFHALQAQLYASSPDTGALRIAVPDIARRACEVFTLGDDDSISCPSGETLDAWTIRLQREVPFYFTARDASPVEPAAPITGQVGDGHGGARLAAANRRRQCTI